MPYRRRYRYARRRRPRRVKKSTALARKGRHAQASQILTLQRQVDRIKRVTKDVTQYRQYQHPQSHTQGGGVSPSYIVFNLVQPDQWTPIFQTPSNQETLAPNKFRGRSVGIETMIQLEDPSVNQAPVTGTVFICSLRKEVAKQFVERTNYGTDMTEEVDYCKSSLGLVQGSGMVFLNKGTFKIHSVRRFMVGGKTNFEDDYEEHDTAPTTNLRDNNVRMYYKAPYRNYLKSDGPDSRALTTTGGFRTLSLETLEPHDQLYMFVFSNAIDGQALAIHSNVVFTGKTSN